VEIAALAIVIIAASLYLWNYFNFNTLDITLRIAFVGIMMLSVSLVANIIVNKRW